MLFGLETQLFENIWRGGAAVCEDGRTGLGKIFRTLLDLAGF